MSEDTRKGVTVTTALNATMNRDFHELATVIQVKDGHLHVNRGSSDTVAIYAPGKWLKAVISE